MHGPHFPPRRAKRPEFGGYVILPARKKPEVDVRESPNPDQQDLRVIGVATGLGCSIVAALILCIGGGVFLDRRFGTTPVLTLLGVALGMAAAGYQLWELVKIGSKTEQAGPVTRTLARLPVLHKAPAPRERRPVAPERDDDRNEE